MLRDLKKLLLLDEDTDKKIHEYQATLNDVTTEIQKIDDALNSITEHLQEMSKHPTYGKYAYLGLEEIQKYQCHPWSPESAQTRVILGDLYRHV